MFDDTEYFTFDLAAALLEVKNRSLPQVSRNPAGEQSSDPVQTIAETAETAERNIDLSTSRQAHEEETMFRDANGQTNSDTKIPPGSIKKCVIDTVTPAVSEVLAASQSDGQQLAQSDCDSLAVGCGRGMDKQIKKHQNLNRIYIDFETRSEVDLKKVGGILYSEHRSTDILCLGVFDASSMNEPAILTSADIRKDITVVKMLTALVQNKNNIFVAHNAGFDQLIWHNVLVKKYGCPENPIHRWRCTMAKASVHGLPGSLSDCAKTLGLPIQKDMEGRANMLVLSKQRKEGGFWTPDEQAEKFRTLYSYCGTDIKVMKLIDSALPDLSDQEQKTWVLNEQMNRQGIYIDRNMVENAKNLADSHKSALEERLKEITNGAVETPKQWQRLLKWLPTRGVKLENTQAPTIAKALNAGNLPSDVRDVFLIWQGGAKSSLAKYGALLDRADVHDRIRDQLQYFGAHTGRFTSKGIQIHNLPKPKIDIDASYKAISTYEYNDFSLLYPDVADTLSQSLRGAFIPSKGRRFFIGDFAQVEARVIAWLAGEQKVLEAFTRGQDLYCLEASKIYGRQITKEDKEERQVGKVAVLALGYGGSIPAFAAMAKSYKLDLQPIYESLWPTAMPNEKDKANYSLEQFSEMSISREEGLAADLIKQRWRANNPNIVNFWERLENSALNAVNSSESEAIDRLHWFMQTDQFLHCKLPIGRSLIYPYPLVGPNKKGKSALSYLSATKGRESTYGGKLAENITQAVARDLLVEALLRLEHSPFKVVFHVHDEIIAEAPPELDIENFKSLMGECPLWASGLPIEVEVRISARYGK